MRARARCELVFRPTTHDAPIDNAAECPMKLLGALLHDTITCSHKFMRFFTFIHLTLRHYYSCCHSSHKFMRLFTFIHLTLRHYYSCCHNFPPLSLTDLNDVSYVTPLAFIRLPTRARTYFVRVELHLLSLLVLTWLHAKDLLLFILP